MRKVLISVFLLSVFSPVFASAATINATSCSYNDVSAAISAAQHGDIVQVPAGTCTWNNNLVITKGIYLIGAGIGNTIITSGWSASGIPWTVENAFIAYNPSSPALNEPFRLSGFTIDLNNRCNGVMLNNPITSPITQVRIDHNSIINGFDWRAIGVRGNVWGVVDNNHWEGMCTNYGLNTNWASLTFSFGTSANMYYEDNTIALMGTAHDAGLGGRYCTRYNKYTYSDPSVHQVPFCDFHGNQGVGQNWATMGVEIYNNTENTGTRTCMIFGARGGRSLVYNNAITQTSPTAAWQMVREEYDDSLNPPATASDGQPQHVSDSYFWSNSWNSNTIYDITVASTVYYSELGRDVPQADADFWLHKASFDGSSGVGIGLLSARPATCTVGVGYWATDQSRLYRCTAMNTWTLYYTPYTYPHPLRTDCTNYPGLCDAPQPEAYWASPTGTSTWANCLSSTPLDGTAACPLATANQNAQAGDTVYLRGGTYLINGSGIDPKNTGTEGHPITFTHYNEEEVIFNYTGSSTSDYAVNLNSDWGIERSYINIHGIIFNNFNRHLWILKGDHNEVSYCTFRGFNADGGTLEWRGSTVYRNATYNHIHHCTFADYGGAGEAFEYNGVIYRDDNGVLFELGNEGRDDDNTSYNLIEDCQLYHGGHHVMGIDGNHNVVRNNYIHNDAWIPYNGSYWGNRVFMFTGFYPANQRNLFEGNRVGYGSPTTDSDCAAGGGTLATKYNILRRNMIYRDGTHGTYLRAYESSAANNYLYNNVYWHNGYDRNQTWKNCWGWEWTHGIIVEDNDPDITQNAFKNNIFYENYNYYGSQYPIIEFWPERNLPDNQIISDNWMEEGDPKFVDISGTPDPMQVQFDFSLQPDSPCIDQGGFLTTITSSSGSGTQFQVADAGYFMDGWGIIEGDTLQLQGQTAKVRITSINYTTNTITVNTTLSWTTGLGVSLAYEGSAPDIGAYEYEGGITPPENIPGDLNNDTRVDIIDLGIVATHFGQTNAHPLWNVTADVVANNEIDIYDVVFVASRFT